MYPIDISGYIVETDFGQERIIPNSGEIDRGASNRLYKSSGFFVSVAPNPATSFTTITFNQPVKNVMISVVDAQGKKVMSEKIGNSTISNYQLNTSKLSAGIYTISFNVEDKVYNEKLVIVR